MQTKVSVSFRIPKNAYMLLELMSKQNRYVAFDLDSEERCITLTCNMVDFAEYSNDWDFEEIENHIKEVE